MTEKQQRAYWKRYARRLTPDEKRSLVNDGTSVSRPRAAGLPVPQIPEGEWIEVRSNYRVKFGPRIETVKTYRYEVTHREDFRARIPRRTPGIFDVPDLDDEGFPLPPTEEAIREATEQGNYTSSASLGVSDIGDAVDPFTQKRLTREARDREMLATGELLAALEDLRDAVDERLTTHPDARRIMGKDAWDLKNKIEAAKRRLQRRNVA